MSVLRAEFLESGQNNQVVIENSYWQQEKGQHWAWFGNQQSHKSQLAAVLAGDKLNDNIKIICNGQVQLVSAAKLENWFEQERQKDLADILDVVPNPTTVEQLILMDISKPDMPLYTHLLKLFNLNTLTQQAFTTLSTGQLKKMQLIRALLLKPDILILDDPYAGLDAHSCQQVNGLLEQICDETSIIMLLDRVSELADFISHIAWVKDARIELAEGIKLGLPHVEQLMHLQQSESSLPQSVGEQHAFAAGSSLVKLTQAKVQFSDKVIFDKLDWHIIAGQHWQIHGPNGSGKSCLLNLISGDNPQCYRNQIELFGITRGQGESIWQIKQHIGYLTNQFHRDYRVNCKVLDCIISGFYDSIGLYQTATFAQQKIAREWLNVIGLASLANKGFRALETGEQRMVLIARAMVKHPPLLILDEPCQGLDSINRQKVLALVELLCQQNTTTLLYVSHHGEDKIPAIEHHLSMLDFHP